jgi:hypothetical protein
MKRILSVLVLLATVSVAAGAVPTVVATHAVYGEFARIVGGDAIDVVTIIPSGFCPDHYDLAPSDVRAVTGASIVFYSGFESWMDTLVSATASTARIVQLPGSWNTPDAAAAKVQAIAGALAALMPEQKEMLEANAASYIGQLQVLGAALREQAAASDASAVPVVCMAWQADFVSWLGFNVATTYGMPESLSLSDLVTLTAAGRSVGARLVIDNLQSGLDFGSKLAREIGAVHVVLSNFPGAMPNTASVLALFAANAAALLSAIELPTEVTP